MGWIGIAGGNAVAKASSDEPYTPAQYNAVLAFFQENAGNFYTVNEVDEEAEVGSTVATQAIICLLYTSPSPRDRQKSRMPSSA